MAKKHDDDERIRIRFDNEDGEALGEEPVIDLFADEDEAASDKPKSGAKKPASKKGEGEPQTVPEPKEKRAVDEADAAEQLARMFDREGRRSGARRKKSKYGKRKNAPKAEPQVVRNETIASREYEAAKARSMERAKRREEKEKRAKERRQSERRARRRSLIRTAAFGAAAAAILLIMTWYTTRIRTIEFTPIPSGYTADELLAVSGLKYGSSIAFQSLTDAKAKLEQDAYLRASLRYDFPSTIKVTLDVRKAAACVRWGPQNEYLAIIDANGIVLDAEAESTGGLIVAEGLSITSAQNGRMLGEATDLQIAGLVRILSTLQEYDLLNRSPRLARIDMSELMNISIATDGANYSIEVGDSQNLETKLHLLEKHWGEIMTKAAQYIASGYSTATIYLYSKGGVAISPYEPGYNTAMSNVMNYTLPSDDPGAATGEPNETPEPGAPPSASPTPAPTQMPHQGGTFTG